MRSSSFGYPNVCLLLLEATFSSRSALSFEILVGSLGAKKVWTSKPFNEGALLTLNRNLLSRHFDSYHSRKTLLKACVSWETKCGSPSKRLDSSFKSGRHKIGIQFHRSCISAHLLFCGNIIKNQKAWCMVTFVRSQNESSVLEKIRKHGCKGTEHI